MCFCEQDHDLQERNTFLTERMRVLYESNFPRDLRYRMIYAIAMEDQQKDCLNRETILTSYGRGLRIGIIESEHITCYMSEFELRACDAGDTLISCRQFTTGSCMLVKYLLSTRYLPSIDDGSVMTTFCKKEGITLLSKEAQATAMKAVRFSCG